MSEREMHFEASRAHLRSVAYRMLGSSSEVEDALQEAWLKITRADAADIANVRAWLTTIVARVCLDMLRARKARREDSLEAQMRDPASSSPNAIAADSDDPERETQLADSIGVALLVVLDTLQPAERVAFVLHDMFDLTFEEIAPIVGRTPVAARQLASRGRRRIQGASSAPSGDRTRRREVVEAFLAASRGGDLGALIAVLDPNVILRADAAAVALSAAREARGAPKLAPEVRGAQAVADVFKGRAQAAQAAILDGAVGAVFAPGGIVRSAIQFTIAGGKVVEIDVIVDPQQLGELQVTILE